MNGQFPHRSLRTESTPHNFHSDSTHLRQSVFVQFARNSISSFQDLKRPFCTYDDLDYRELELG